MKWSLVKAAQFSVMADRWAELHARCHASPMLALDFVQPLVAQFGEGGEYVACCEHDGRIVRALSNLFCQRMSLYFFPIPVLDTR